MDEHYRGAPFEAFSSQTWSNYQDYLFKALDADVNKRDRNYILNIDKEKYIEDSYNYYKLDPIEIDVLNPFIPEPQIRPITITEYRQKRTVNMYCFFIQYSFSGSTDLFRIEPNPCVSPTASIHIDPSFHKVAFEIQIEDLSETAFTEELERYQQLAFANVVYINHHVRDFNACLKGQIEDRFTERYSVSLNEKRVFTAINVVKTKQADVIAVPVIQRKVVIQPKTHQSESYADEPTLRQDIYEDVLSVLYNVGKSLERKPSLYLSKGEEQLRDLFLLFLETRYEAITATGETFNRMGKTDILLRHGVDGSNLFIAECKIWKGQAEYLKAIDQLLGYLTWRDSKASVILFVRQNEFSSVLSKIVQSTPQHPNFHKETGKRGESSFSYKFNLPQDKNKQIYLEIIAFHFDTKFESEVRELRLK